LHEKDSISWDGKAAPTKVVVVVVLKYSADIVKILLANSIMKSFSKSILCHNQQLNLEFSIN